MFSVAVLILSMPIHSIPMTINPRQNDTAATSESTSSFSFSDTSLPLTFTVTLTEPTPTQTNAAVTTAYALYASLCGPELSQALRDYLGDYLSLHPSIPDLTDVTDPDYMKWVHSWEPYAFKQEACDQADKALLHAERSISAASFSLTAPCSSSSASPSSSIATAAGAARSTQATAVGKIQNGCQRHSIGPKLFQALNFFVAGDTYIKCI
ncbi:hypothetical protein C8R43DRAFT_1136674 [Mycena crocata]|nr:hypothetical protein C8R43DRAFT_1136674 [Mycena crocata]